MRYILGVPLKKAVTIKEVSDETYILQDDLVSALKEMDVVEKRKTGSGNVVVNKSKVRAWGERHGVSTKSLIDLDAFVDTEEHLEVRKE